MLGPSLRMRQLEYPQGLQPLLVLIKAYVLHVQCNYLRS